MEPWGTPTSTSYKYETLVPISIFWERSCKYEENQLQVLSTMLNYYISDRQSNIC